MDWNEIKTLANTIEKYSPLLLRFITPLNPSITSIISVIAEVFESNSSDISELSKKIDNDPNVVEKLKDVISKITQAQNLHEENLYKTETNDIQNARQRELEKERLLEREDYMLDLIALVVIIGFFGMCLIVMFEKIDESTHDLLYMLIGQLTAGFVMVVSYYFGSSKKR